MMTTTELSDSLAASIFIMTDEEFHQFREAVDGFKEVEGLVSFQAARDNLYFSLVRVSVKADKPCQKEQMSEGIAWPRSCYRCGLGPCQKGYDPKWTPENPVGKGPK